MLILLGVAVWLKPAGSPAAVGNTAPVAIAEVQAVLAARCAGCHAEHPTLVASAPAGLMFDTPERIEANKARIVQQAVQLKVMPPANLTHISDDERALLGRWGSQ